MTLSMRDHLSDRADFWNALALDGVAYLDHFADLVARVLAEGGTLFFAGNGGSAADAQHLAAEYVGIGHRALALTTDTSVLTATANDRAYEEVFAAQLEALAMPEDLLVVHSTSGNSPNVVQAVLAARSMAVRTVALTGSDGGKLGPAADLCIKLPTNVTALAQEAHLAIGHMVFDRVRQG